MTPHTDLRKHPRYPLNAPIQVSWRDRRGFQWQDRGHCVDASKGGLRMELPHAVPVNVWIRVSLAQLDLDSSVLVRHCTFHASKYLIGAAFQSTPSGFLQAVPALHKPDQLAPDQDPSLGRRLTLDQPPDDDIRKFFQDVRTRKTGRTGSTEARRKRWLRVTLIATIAAGVLFILTLPRLLRLATATYQHLLLQESSASVEAVVDYSYKKR